MHFAQPTLVLLVPTVLSRRMTHSCFVQWTPEVFGGQQCPGIKVEGEACQISGENGRRNPRELLPELIRQVQAVKWGQHRREE
jgi:hypothetical protein